MRRPDANETSSAGQDSFLDVVTNMVGILIILMLVAGLRVQKASTKTLLAVSTADAATKLREKEEDEKSARGDLARLELETRQLQAHAQARFEHRNQLATLAAAAKQQIDERRQKLDGESQQEFDAAQALRQVQADIDLLRQQRLQAEQIEAPAETVQHRPTPLGKIVEGDEVHFRIQGGRIVTVPLNDLVRKLRGDAESKVGKLRSQPEIVETIGPIDGFRLRYRLIRRDALAGEGRGGSVVQLGRFELIPVTESMGETAEQALAANSLFRLAITGLKPSRSTVTLWVYPDSFGTFRQIKDELYRLGFSVAARPMPDGVFIGGSPQGSKSAAE